MPKIDRASLMPLETYAKERTAFRAKVMAHKKHRQIALGAHLTLSFEDELTMRYQVQEMLRVERIFEEAGIHDELDAYNPLIPGGSDWRATMLVEFPDADERRVQLKYLRAVEHAVYARIGERRLAVLADEDMERSDEEKTSAVHFLRFALDAQDKAALRAGAVLAFGIEHPRYRYETELHDAAARDSLIRDLD
jgi:hypothetical protein